MRAREITLVHRAHVLRRALQIRAVARIQTGPRQHLRQLGAVMLLEQIAQQRRALAVGQVLVHRVDEKQADGLDAAHKQLLFALEMVGNRAPHQQRLHLVGQHAAARGLAQRQRQVVGENQFALGDFLHYVAVQV